MRSVMKRMSAVIGAGVLMLAFCSCGQPKENRVFSAADLPGKVIGVQMGTTGDIYCSAYQNDGSDTIVERYTRSADAVQALKQGRLDCVVIDEQPANVLVEEYPDLQILDDLFSEEEYAICVNKGNLELLQEIDQALADLIADGTRDEIISNYIGDDTKGKHPYVSPADADHSKGKLMMATHVAFEPYEYYEKEKATGIDVDLARAIGDRIGYEIDFFDIEFDAIIPAVTTHRADFGMAGMTVTEERKQEVDFSKPYATSRLVIITRK